jgi:hypothetical protein
VATRADPAKKRRRKRKGRKSISKKTLETSTPKERERTASPGKRWGKDASSF